jgi:cysteine desulfuration protein SufE
MTAKTIEELAESFDLFDNWEDRYRYLIDLGTRLPPMDDSLKTDETLVRGCTSKVWMVAGTKEDSAGVPLFHFLADSNAQIVRGLIYVLMLAYQDKPLAAIGGIDIGKSFARLGLEGHLSPSRRNGFFAMVERIRAQGGAA